MNTIAKFLIIFGLVFIIVGLLFLVFPKMNLLRLPGDIIIKRENFVFIFPVVTGIILSVIVTILLNLIFRR